MKAELVFGSFLILSTLTFYSIQGKFNEEIFQKRAIQKLLTQQFLVDYSNWVKPSESSSKNGEKIFDQFHSKDAVSTGRSAGTINDVGVDKIQKIFDLWVKKGLISSTEGSELQTHTTATPVSKTIRESYYLTAKGDIVYGLIGYLPLTSTSKSEATATVPYSFLKFRLMTPLKGILYSRSGSCILWELYCQSSVEYQNEDGETLISGNEAGSLSSYYKDKAIESWLEENGPYVNYIDKEATQYERFLPQELTDAKKKISDNPNVSPDKLFSTDPFNANNYDL